MSGISSGFAGGSGILSGYLTAELGGFGTVTGLTFIGILYILIYTNKKKLLFSNACAS
jgi:hypothetical protein